MALVWQHKKSQEEKMSNRQNKWFWLSIMLAAGMTFAGCGDDDSGSSNGGDGSTCKEGDANCSCTNGNCSQIIDQSKVDPVCYSSTECGDDPKCNTDAGYKVCQCVSAKNKVSLCHNNAECNGIKDSATDYSCSYTCGTTEGSCEWNVCKNSAACGGGTSGSCSRASASADPDGDADNDGISNIVELNNNKLDPCNPDVDGDGVKDGDEDLNGNGVYEPDFGETDFADPSSKPEPASLSTIQQACDASELLKGGVTQKNKIKVAHFYDETTTYDAQGASDDTSVILMDDSKSNVHGFFYRDNIGVTGKLIVQHGIEKYLSGMIDSVFYEESNFESDIPLASWAEGKYEAALQGVPNHKVQRLQYALSVVDGQSVTPTQVRDALARYLSSNAGIQSSASSTPCSSNAMRVYIARSMYEGEGDAAGDTIYSVGVACAADIKDGNKAQIQMDNIISGTQVAPETYDPYKKFVCQTETVGESTGMVDFIWVVDNSGSMADEQSSVVATAQAFITKLQSQGIDFHIGVAMTDSYMLEESYEYQAQGYSMERVSNVAPYLSRDGLRFSTYTNPGMCTPDPGSSAPGNVAKHCFEMSVSTDTACRRTVNSVTTSKKNICGYGTEDGLESARFVLSQLANPSSQMIKDAVRAAGWYDSGVTLQDAEKKIAESCKVADQAAGEAMLAKCDSGDEAGCYDDILSYYKSTGNAQCQRYMEGIKLRDSALKYIVWVSDENSRQFKLTTQTSSPDLTVYDYGTKKPNGGQYSTLVCERGYELSTSNPDASTGAGTMAQGQCKAGTIASGDSCDGKVCNKVMTINDTLADGSKELNESMDFMAMKGGEHDFEYQMLLYYMMEYQKYAGTGGIAAFSIVGDDAGSGGSCQALNEDTGFGADYGWDYITAARYLSKFEKYEDGSFVDADGNYKMTGKGGGFASICNTNYQNIVDAILADAVGRVSSHTLKGYPISSTIRVSVNVNGKAQALTRGASENGFTYDASQNSIIFTGVSSDLKSDDFISIAYVVWDKNQG